MVKRGLLAGLLVLSGITGITGYWGLTFAFVCLGVGFCLAWQFRNPLIFLGAVYVGLLVILITCLEAPGQDICSNVTINWLRKHVPVPPGRIVFKKPMEGLCEVILEINGEYVPVFTGKDFVIAGEMFKNRKHITGLVTRALKKQRFLQLQDKLNNVVAISYVPTTHDRKHTIYLFTDPVCPYCNLAEKKIKALVDKYNAELKIIFYPVHLPVGKQKAIEAVCRKLDFSTYIQKDWEKENKTEQFQCERGRKLVEASMEIAKKLGIRGTPTFFVDGEEVVGANIPLLEKQLKGNSKQIR